MLSYRFIIESSLITCYLPSMNDVVGAEPVGCKLWAAVPFARTASNKYSAIFLPPIADGSTLAT